MPIAHTLEQLVTDETTSLRLVSDCLDAIANPNGEGPRTFLRVAAETARASASGIDGQRRSGRGAQRRMPLAGLPVSIKDLFDVVDEPTAAGSSVLVNAPSAAQDATVVTRLRRAGAVLMGRTNMTEFAFSGLGINPHYGTPRNPYDRATGRIPGGSSSGAAISVSDRMAHAAIGSDTGGSVRIPAALCGLTGFKPTARRVPTTGVLPLSKTLDSIGPIAPTVACCALLDSVLAGDEPQELTPPSLAGLRLGVLQGYVLEGLDKPVSDSFASALALLSYRGVRVTDVHFKSLNRIPVCNQSGGLAAAESYGWHRHLLERYGPNYDPRVLSRILRGKQIRAEEYVDLLEARQEIIADVAQAFAGFDAILLPTVPRVAPAIAELERSDEAYFEANAAMLRNPSVFNFLDGCALSIPCHLPGDAPTGLMIAGLSGTDWNVLNTGAAVEAVLASGGRAIHTAAGYKRPGMGSTTSV
jgi:aspartyl-tRNA(Asn)/glutamyl-tRNA(Gln) amidotransferase subunit A